MRFVVGGGTGFIGRALVDSLRSEGDEVVTLVRGEGTDSPRRRGPEVSGVRQVGWDPYSGHVPTEQLEGTDAFVNLAGAPIAGSRWTPSRKDELYRSRIAPTELIARSAARISPGAVLVNASAIGFYGDRGSETLTEASGPGDGFLAGLCKRWEEATEPASAAGMRVVNLRSGIVLSASGGAIKVQLPIFRLGLGGTLGRGGQWVSWISLRDEVRAIRHAATCREIHGGLNLVAPEPVTNAQMTKALAGALHRPALFKVPALALRVALGAGPADEMLLASQRALPEKLEATGFAFELPSIDAALEAAVSGGS